MKKLIGAAILILLVYSCKKNAGNDPGTSIYLHSVLSHLRDSLSATDLSQLDTTKGYLTDPRKSGNYTLRLPFKGKSISGDFVLLQTDANGNILRSRVVHLENDSQDGTPFSGNIRLSSLSGMVILQSKVSNGYLEALHGGGITATPKKLTDSKTTTVLPAPDADWLPEVVVVGYGSGSAPSNYISLDGLLGAASSGILNSGGGDGSASDGGNSGGGGGASSGSQNSSNTSTPPDSTYYAPLDPSQIPRFSSSGGGITITDAVQFEKEYVYSIPTIDIRKFFNCFDLVPSDGATYSIQLCVDLPINSTPEASMNFSGGVNAGHTFLVLTKSGNGINVTQCFGYYPQSAPSAWNPFLPIPSAMKDNGDKEINASITMSIDSKQFDVIKSTAINLSTNSYTLDKSNCTDYALGVFNSTRSTPLTMQPYVLRQAGIALSNGMASSPITVTINSSPQKLYAELSDMKSNGNAEASNIQLDLSHNLRSPISHGPCN